MVPGVAEVDREVLEWAGEQLGMSAVAEWAMCICTEIRGDDEPGCVYLLRAARLCGRHPNPSCCRVACIRDRLCGLGRRGAAPAPSCPTPRPPPGPCAAGWGARQCSSAPRPRRRSLDEGAASWWGCAGGATAVARRRQEGGLLQISMRVHLCSNGAASVERRLFQQQVLEVLQQGPVPGAPAANVAWPVVQGSRATRGVD